MEEHWGHGELLAALSPSRADDTAFRAFVAKLERSAASPRTAAALIRLIGATDVSSILAQINVPTLILHRADDPYVDVRHAHYLAERIPNAQLTIVPGADHYFTVGDIDSVLRPGDRRSSPASRGRSEADRFLTTVLITDIVDSTRTAAQIGDERWTRLLADHFAACREQVARYRGELVKTTGDGDARHLRRPGARRPLRARHPRRVARRRHRASAPASTPASASACPDDSPASPCTSRRAPARSPSARSCMATRTVRDLAVGALLDFDPRGTRELKGVPGSWDVFAVSETGQLARPAA